MPLSNVIKRIRRLFGGTTNFNEGIRVVVNTEKLEQRVAVVENGMLEEYTIERTGTQHIVGSIYKGRIRNIEQGLKAMFVDVGLEKNAFLHFWDAIPAADNEEEGAQRDEIEHIDRGGKAKAKKKKITAKDIPGLYPVGAEILVQVTKGPIGNKGPRVTTNISLPGRFLVLMPLNDMFGISRKIDEPKERERLRKILRKLNVPDGMGVIMRTVCMGKRARYFVRDLAMLVKQWDEISTKANSRNAPACAFQEPDLVERTVRDFLTEEVDEVICDDEPTTERMRQLVGLISRRSKKRIHYVQSPEPIFDKLGIQKQIDNAFHRQVWLKCGGYIVIDETEALIAIDVNTGRNKGSDDLEKTILQTNLEAAEEVARQLRLRNMGGLIVVDLIDMKHRRDQQAVYKMMKDRMRRDKAKVQVLPISALGLMEMTRQRLHESLSTAVYDACPTCHGNGRLKSTETMSVELQRRLNTILQKYPDTEHDLMITVSPEVMHRLRTKDEQLLVELERKHRGRLSFRVDPAQHRETVLITNAQTGKEVK
ncbi:MAG TPA: Rne/Rng family ribonuclease [Verrucomicrobiales bacterium]|nr:Rne/Rng family ribonuclease [Verrucomicrobiales bacterium]